MRILLSFKWRGHEVAKKLEEAGHEIIYLITLENQKAKELLPDTIIHNKRLAQKRIWPEYIDVSKFSPPTKELIEKLSDTESIALTMMNHHEGHLCVDERRHIYYEHLRYWSGILRRYRIETVIFDDTPHALNTFVIDALARIMGLKIIIFQKIRISDRFLVFSNWREAGQRIYQQYLKLIKSKTIRLNDLSEDIRQIYLSFKNRNDSPLYDLKPFMIDRPNLNLINQIKIAIKKLSTLVKVIKEDKLSTAIRVNLNQYRRLKLAKTIIKEYRITQSQPDWNEKFVYFGLHYQPERTTCPQGDIFADQLLVAECIANSLPEDWKLYIKEHPMQWRPEKTLSATNVRYPGYYQALSRLPNAKILPISTPTLQLIDRCQVVATVTGTPAIEGIMSDKPAIVFGLPWYLGCPGIFHTQSVNECKTTLAKIGNGYMINQSEVLCYLKAVDEVSFHAYIQIKTMLATNSKLTLDVSMDEIYNRLFKELDNKV